MRSRYQRLAEAATVVEGLTPTILEFADSLTDGSRLYVGCGSSFDVAAAVAATMSLDPPQVAAGGDALAGRLSAAESDVIMVSRSGETKELVDLLAVRRPDYVLTCMGQSTIGQSSVRNTLDLAAAQDDDEVSLLSTLVTFAVIATLEAAPSSRTRSLQDLVAALRPPPETELTESPSSGVVWLVPYGQDAIGRELSRKTIESGRTSMHAHHFEFLHGHDMAFDADGWTWVLVEGDDTSAIFRELAGGRPRRARLIEMRFDWHRARAIGIARLLFRCLRWLYRGPAEREA